MKAIVVRPGQKDSIHMRDMPDPKMKPDQVAVKMLRVGRGSGIKATLEIQ